ncbi:MAG: hypothetical protein J6T38_07290 [Bacteroidaceae bacterium]|nr:hypothetical protein [Bacteroidaceae bacterium]
MKKKLIYLASICIGLAFVACSTDGHDVSVTNESASSSSAPTLGSDLVEPLTLRFFDSSAPFSEIALTETRKAILTKNKPIPSTSRRRSGSDQEDYIIGTYTFNGKNNTYTITVDGEEYCTVEVTNKETGQKTTAKIHMMSGSEIEALDEEFEAEVTEKVTGDVVSTKLCREWEVVSTRLRHRDGVTAVKHFENPDSAASLNAILDYAKTVATITEDLKEGTTITSIEFTKNGKFCLFFENGNHYIGTWHWTDLSKGYLSYDWNDEEMGNKFMKNGGEAIFDVREFKKVKYYVLTLASTIEEKNKTYKVELSFYLKEKTK